MADAPAPVPAAPKPSFFSKVKAFVVSAIPAHPYIAVAVAFVVGVIV